MSTQINEWENLNYINPEKVLPKLYELQLVMPQLYPNADQRVLDLRTRKLKHHAEKRIGAIFCFGMSCYLKKSIFFAPAPSNGLDYDIISKYKDGDVISYVPIQLKEVVPLSINANTDINLEIRKLQARYPTSFDITVVIQYNRKDKFRLSDIIIPKLNIRALWIIGASLPDQSKWFMSGDMLNNPEIFQFDYPEK